MSQMYPQQQQSQPTTQFPERWNWEGEDLVLAYNPYDQTRSQLRPDYSRLKGESGRCFPVQFLNRMTGEEIRTFVVLAKVTAPAEPGSLVPEKHYRCFRLYSTYVEPQLVDWSTLVFYEIKPRESGVDVRLNEGQRFMDTLLGLSVEPAGPDPREAQWAQDFMQIQQVAGPDMRSEGTAVNVPEKADASAE